MANIRNIIGSSLIALGIFASWGFTLPNYQAASALKQVVIDKEMESVKKREIVDKIKGWSREYENRKDEIDRFQKIIPEKKRLEEIIVAFEKIMAESGLTISGLSFSESKGAAASGFDLVALEASVKGSYLSLITLLNQIESNIRLMDVISIDIPQPTVVSGESLSGLIINLKVQAYVAKERVAPAQSRTQSIDNE